MQSLAPLHRRGVCQRQHRLALCGVWQDSPADSGKVAHGWGAGSRWGARM